MYFLKVKQEGLGVVFPPVLCGLSI